METHNLKLIFAGIIMVVLASCVSAYETGSMTLKCQLHPNFNIKEKEYCIGEIPTNYTNQGFKCFSYVKLGTETKQTNPQYKERANSLFSFFANDVESREYFESANYIVNVYYTGKNLLPNYNYTVGIICNSDTYSLTGETGVSIDYENLDFLFARMQWASRNAGYIIGGILLLVVIIGGIVILWRVTFK